MGVCHGSPASRAECPANMRVFGRRRAVLAGLNYRGTSAELRGCINDMTNQKSVLQEHYGFSEKDILMLHEDQPKDKWPYKARIMEGIRWLYEGAGPGDLLFFHYSGHGSQFQTADGVMADCLCPLDCLERPWPGSIILDTEIHQALYDPLAAGVKVVAIFDCCHSGTVANLPVKRDLHVSGEHAPKARYLKAPAMVGVKETQALAGIRRGVLAGQRQDHQLWVFSGCQDNQTSADAYVDGQFQGAFTWAMIKALRGDVWNQTYIDLLDQIRANLKGYTQVPALTTTSEPYLNYWYCGREPEAASREVHAVDREVGRRKALLIGINYRRSRNELRGCINDVATYRELLIKHYGFKESEMLILTEDESRENWPYKARIVEGMQWLMDGAREGDTLFLSYSGHGSQMMDSTGTEPSGMSQCICPLDCNKPWPEHIILDTEIHTHLYDCLPEGVKLTCVFDCCHSGTVANLEFKRDLHFAARGFEEVPAVPEKYRSARYMEPPQAMSQPHSASILGLACRRGLPAQLKKASGFRSAVADRNLYENRHLWVFSGCQDNQTSADAYVASRYQGAFTWALASALQGQKYSAKYQAILHQVRATLSGKYAQVPALSTTRRTYFDRFFLGKHAPELAIDNTCYQPK